MSDVRGARSVRMMNDPDLGGELLLVGLVLAAKQDFGLKVQNVGDVGELAFPNSTKPVAIRQVRWVLKEDIRRYRPPRGRADEPCSAPMIRRGGPCGKRSSYSGWLTDWSTGESRLHASCSRHRDWWWRVQQENRAAKPDIVPLPHANHGGVLRKHLPDFNWPKLWQKLDPKWVEHPERVAWPKPTLSLVLGDSEWADDLPKITLVGLPGGGKS